MNHQNNNQMGEQIQKVTDDLMAKGVPARTAAYAAAMGYMRTFKKK